MGYAILFTVKKNKVTLWSAVDCIVTLVASGNSMKKEILYIPTSWVSDTTVKIS